VKEGKGLLTIAIGEKYALQAKYLALSCILNTPQTIRSVITDCPEILGNYYDILIPYDDGESDPFSVKTRLFGYTPFEKTMYIDADSLVISSIDACWDVLERQFFAYAGDLLLDGTWYFDLHEVRKKIDTPWMPQLNSGMFIFDNSEEAKNIFETAYYYFINHRKENIMVPFFRGKSYPDEPFFSIALAKHGVKPIEDRGRFSRTLINAENIHVDVIKGIAFYNKDGNVLFPHIVHFCGKFGNFFYCREKIKLNFYFNPPFQSLFSYLLSSIRRLWNFFSGTGK
jgi:hypothetical protein